MVQRVIRRNPAREATSDELDDAHALENEANEIEASADTMSRKGTRKHAETQRTIEWRKRAAELRQQAERLRCGWGW